MLKQMNLCTPLKQRERERRESRKRKRKERREMKKRIHAHIYEIYESKRNQLNACACTLDT